MNIGFIGLGAMGSGIALNLCKAGHSLVVYDLNKQNAQACLEAGAVWAENVTDIGKFADVVFSSVPGPTETRDLGLGKDGLLESMRPGTTWFDLTTNSPTVVREVMRPFQEKGIALLDAPVSGGPSGAKSGKLAIYVGGDRDVFDKHKQLLDAIGDKIMYVGTIGAGNTAKLVHNLVSLVMRMTIAEGMSLGVKAGMDPLELWHAVRQGVIGRNRTFDLIGDQYLQSKYDQTGFNLRLGIKDFTLALNLAKELDVPMKQADAAFEDYMTALERGWGDLDSRIPMLLQNERANVVIEESAVDVEKTLNRI